MALHPQNTESASTETTVQPDTQDADQAIMQMASASAKAKNYEKAIALWNKITPESAYYQTAQKNIAKASRMSGAASAVKASEVKQPVDSSVRSWALSLEAGNGAIIGTTLEYRFGLFGIGAGAGFDYSIERIVAVDYPILFFSGSAIAFFHFLDESDFIIDGRLRAGYSFLQTLTAVATYGGGIELTPEVLLGVYNIYAIGSCVFLFSKEINIIPQIGIGYRLRF
ncbi:MAG: hypothetical protein HZC28_05810 [Spirochaetes bacterium]|nr:hypothetical protein [Spirochaetota bacterium]